MANFLDKVTDKMEYIHAKVFKNVFDMINYIKKHPDVEQEFKDAMVNKLCSNDNHFFVLFFLLNDAKDCNLSDDNIEKLVIKICESKDSHSIKSLYSIDIVSDKYYPIIESYFEFVTVDTDIISLIKYHDISDRLTLVKNMINNRNTIVVLDFMSAFYSKIGSDGMQCCINKLIELDATDEIAEFSKLPICAPYIDLFIDYMLSKCSPNGAYEFAVKNDKNLQRHHIEKLINFFKKCDDSEYLILFTRNIEALKNDEIHNLSKIIIDKDDNDDMVELCSTKDDYKYSILDEDKNLVAKKLIEKEDVANIYKFLIDNHNKIDPELKKEMINIILSSNNMKLICLVALLIETSLIIKIFGSKERLYAYLKILNVDLADIGLEEEIIPRSIDKDTLISQVGNNILKFINQ